MQVLTFQILPIFILLILSLSIYPTDTPHCSHQYHWGSSPFQKEKNMLLSRSGSTSSSSILCIARVF
eukprot:gene8948-18510_t